MSANKFFTEFLERNKKLKIQGGYLIPEVADFPENRWEEFKERYFPYFFKRLMPVKYKRINIRKNLLKVAIEKSKIS